MIVPCGTIHPHNIRSYVTDGIDFELLDPEMREHMPRQLIEEFEKDLTDSRQMQALCDDALVRRTGMSPEQVRALCRKDETLTATQALALNIVDEIILPMAPQKKDPK